MKYIYISKDLESIQMRFTYVTQPIIYIAHEHLDDVGKKPCKKSHKRGGSIHLRLLTDLTFSCHILFLSTRCFYLVCLAWQLEGVLNPASVHSLWLSFHHPRQNLQSRLCLPGFLRGFHLCCAYCLAGLVGLVGLAAPAR